MSFPNESLARAFGRLEGALAAFVPASDNDGLIAMLRRAEVVASSRLDGNQGSLIDLLDSESGLAVTGPSRDIAELRALAAVMAGMPDVAKPTLWLLQVHGDLMKRLGSTGLGWRSAPLWIGASGATRAEARHIPPAPEQIPALMLNWEQSLLNESLEPPILKLSQGLAALESIHPFTEANARVARIWVQHALMEYGFLKQPILFWSTVLLRRGHEARHAIQAHRSEAGDADPWTPLLISLLREAADETTDVVCRVAALRSRHRQMIAADFGRSVPQALRLADALMATPMMDIKAVIELTGVTFPAANDLVRRFERAGLLVEVTGNARNRRFRYAPYVRIFLDA
jgi:Fic family protein